MRFVERTHACYLYFVTAGLNYSPSRWITIEGNRLGLLPSVHKIPAFFLLEKFLSFMRRYVFVSPLGQMVSPCINVFATCNL